MAITPTAINTIMAMPSARAIRYNLLRYRYGGFSLLSLSQTAKRLRGGRQRQIALYRSVIQGYWIREARKARQTANSQYSLRR